MIELQKVKVLLVLGVLFSTLHAKDTISNLSSFNHNCIVEVKSLLYNKSLGSNKSMLIRKKKHLHAIYSKKPTNSIIINDNKLIKTTYGKVITRNVLSNEGIMTIFKFGPHHLTPLLEGYDLEIEKETKKEQRLHFIKRKKNHNRFTNIKVKIDKRNDVVTETELYYDKGKKSIGKAKYKYIRENKKSRKKTPYFDKHTFISYDKNNKKLTEYNTKYLTCNPN